MKRLLSAHPAMCQAPALALCAALLLALGAVAEGAVSHQLLSFNETNYTGYVISSDRNNANAAYNRDAIEVTAHMRFTRSGTDQHQYMYRYRFQLLDDDGVAHTLDLGGGSTGTILEIFNEVNMAAANPTVIDRFIEARVTPAASAVKMNPYKNYRVEVNVARRLLNPVSLVYSTDLITAQTTPQPYKHFRQLVTGDAALNVITELLSTNVSRIYRVQTDPNNDAFRVTATVRTYRYDEFHISPVQTDVTTRVSVVLRDDLDNIVPLEQSVFDFTHQHYTYSPLATVPIEPRVATFDRVLNLRPTGQLSSRNRTYTATVTVGHFETPGASFPLAGNIRPTPVARLLDFNGTIVVNGVNGSFSSIATPGPAVDGLGANHVLTSLRVNGLSGELLGMQFGNGTELPVRLANNGTATLDSGSITLSGTSLPLTPGNIFYSLENVAATPTGFSGNVRLRFPSGLGTGFDETTRIHEPAVVFPGVTLTAQLTPVEATLVAAGSRWVSEESKPFIFESSFIYWDVNDDRIRFDATGNALYVRREAVWDLVSDVDVSPSERSKPSNDLYYWGINSIISPQAVINIDGNGSALLTIELSLNGLGFFVPYRPHFPLGLDVVFNSGSQRIVNDRVVPSFGGLAGVSRVRMSYTRDCPDGDCGGVAGAQQLDFIPDSALLHFTRDGGITASGVLNAPHVLRWGWIADKNDFAHSVFTFDDAGFHMPGSFLTASQIGATDPVQLPARLLYTGVHPSAADTIERPGTNAYKAGLGDYAGLNFRVVDWGDQDGRIVLAGQAQPNFPLTNRAKYLVRMGGITGIHEAITGLFNPTATIYGVDFEFSSLGWGFLDGKAVISRTGGGLHVGGPSDFGLDFDKLMIDCIGALEGAEISPADQGAFKKLAYWNADFRPLALSFEGKEDALCDPSDRRLVLGVEAFAGGIAQALSGRIAFQLDGNLVTLESQDLDAPFDSRFRLPNNFTLAGPGTETYRATPVGEAYLNDYNDAQDADFGWMNIAAYLDVPFFSDLETHIHTSALKDDDNGLYHIMGGYPSQGYNKNGDHFFNQTIFDVSNRGFPKDVTFQQYRAGVAKYRPAAVKRWLGVINFEYPLTWRPASRSFVSFEDLGNDFLVLYAEHRIDYLSPEFVEISFGAGISIAPVVNLANFVADKAGDVLEVLTNYLNTEFVDKGVAGLNEVLDVKQREFFALALQPAINTTVDAVMAALLANWNPATKTWSNGNLGQEINKGLNHVDNGLVKQIQAVLEAASTVAGVLKEVDTRLGQAEDALTAIESFIAETDDNALGDLENAVVGLASLVSAALDKPEFKEKIEAILKKAEPRIIEVRKVIGEIRDYISQVRNAMGEGGAFLAQVTELVGNNVGAIEGTLDTIRNDILASVQTIQPGIDSFPQKEAALRAEMKQRIEDYVLGLRVVADFNRLIKQRIYDTTALFTAAIDEVFDQINLTVREVVREVVGGLEEKFDEMLGDDINTTMFTADIKGYAKIRNDSLTELRLDLKAQLNIPDEMKVHVYLLIRELNSENTDSVCLPSAGKVTEVTMGAKDIAVEWLFPDTTISIYAKFIFESQPDNLFLRGFGAGFDIKGEISFGESIKILQLGASVMFGKDEFYISAAAGIEVQGFSGSGGIFLGRACSLDPFFWDETVAAVLGDPPFTGMYGYGEFWIPIPTLIGIPSTCLFNLSAGVGAGAGFFIEGPTVFGKMFLGVSGDVLCIISITGEISLVGLARPSGLSLAGQGRFKAELGWCPLCLKIEKSILMTRENKKWTRGVK